MIPGSTPSDGGNRNTILLVGAPFTGKSTAAATFPNPVFLDFDHKAPAGTTTIPFWDAQFVDKLAPRKNPNHRPNVKDALLNYFSRHILTSDTAQRIPFDHTIILDSMSKLEENIHQQIKQEGIPIGKGGQPDGFHLWKVKLDYLSDLFSIIQAWPGTFICIMHETPEYNESGGQTGRIKPLLSGSYADKIASKFTCMFRQRVIPATPSTPAQYVWDVQPTRAFDSNNVLGIKAPVIPATYKDMIANTTLK